MSQHQRPVFLGKLYSTINCHHLLRVPAEKRTEDLPLAAQARTAAPGHTAWSGIFRAPWWALDESSPVGGFHSSAGNFLILFLSKYLSFLCSLLFQLQRVGYWIVWTKLLVVFSLCQSLFLDIPSTLPSISSIRNPSAWMTSCLLDPISSLTSLIILMTVSSRASLLLLSL